MPIVATMRWITNQALPWVAVVALGAMLVFGEIGLARFGAWVAMQTDSGTPCGQILCSCPTSPLSRSLAVAPCGQGSLKADLPGHICSVCGQDTAPATQSTLYRMTSGHHPGLLLMACVCPLVLVLAREDTPHAWPMRGRRFARVSARRARTRTLGVDPHPPKHT